MKVRTRVRTKVMDMSIGHINKNQCGRRSESRSAASTLEAAYRAALSNIHITMGLIICVGAGIAASLIPPLLLADMVDSLTCGAEIAFTAVLIYFIATTAENMLGSAQESLLVVFGQRMMHELRSEMSEKLTRLTASSLVSQNPGEITSRFSGDVDTVEALFTSGIISMIADVLRIISIMAVIAARNKGLAALLLLILPFFALFTRHVQRRMLSAQLDNRRAVAAVSGLVPESIHNIRTIHMLGIEEYMERRYGQRIDESYAAIERTNYYDAVYSPVVLMLDAVVVGAVMLLSASGNKHILTLFGMSVGTSVAVISYISRIFAPIESLGMEIQTLQSAMAGVRRIDAFLQQPERDIVVSGEKTYIADECGNEKQEIRMEVADCAGKAGTADEESNSTGNEEEDIVLSHVTFGYGERDVLRDFSMTVKRGEHVTLAGRTGAGKSTIFKLLLGLYTPQSGSISVCGSDPVYIPDDKRRRCIGCVEQHFSRIPGSVLEQITLGDPGITRDMAQAAARMAGIDDVILSLEDGYDTICTEGMFSQGEWQLLSIARAVASDPRVLLLDEITASLDARTELRVLDALRRASGGRTVLSISHRIYSDMGGRVVYLDIALSDM